MSERAKNHLKNVILPYWNNLVDTENGGWYGYVDYDLNVNKESVKGVILHSRILWFYSTTYATIGGDENLKNATHAYKFLKENCFDEKNGGLFWMMNPDGSVNDDTKNAYNQAFGIYGLCAYYKITGDKEALRLAYSLFECIETYCTDQYGYLEAFEVDWKKPVESAICDQGITADKTMNTLLHILEAYTLLLHVDSHPLVAKTLVNILKLCRDKLYYSDFERLEVFFDTYMNPLGDIHSYGHDIEATWLLDKACDALQDNINVIAQDQKLDVTRLLCDTRTYTTTIAKKILDCAFKNGALNNESRGERAGKIHVDTDRMWWVEAEAIVGFWNEYEKHGNTAFADAAKQIFNYIEEYIVDKRKGSEWFWYLTEDGTPKKDHGITEPWKCPYHNGRMCLEMILRNANI